MFRHFVESSHDIVHICKRCRRPRDLRLDQELFMELFRYWAKTFIVCCASFVMLKGERTLVMVEGREIQRTDVSSAERNSLGIEGLHKQVAGNTDLLLVVFQGVDVVDMFRTLPDHRCFQSVDFAQPFTEITSQANPLAIKVIKAP